MSGAKKKAEATQPAITDPAAPASGSVAPPSSEDSSKDDKSNDAPNEDSAAKPKAPKKPKGYFVAKGKSVGTRSRGIVSEHDQVFPADFSAGQERIDQLATAGYVVAK